MLLWGCSSCCCCLIFGLDKLKIDLSDIAIQLDGTIDIGMATAPEELVGNLFLASVFLILDRRPAVSQLSEFKATKLTRETNFSKIIVSLRMRTKKQTERAGQ